MILLVWLLAAAVVVLAGGWALRPARALRRAPPAASVPSARPRCLFPDNCRFRPSRERRPDA